MQKQRGPYNIKMKKLTIYPCYHHVNITSCLDEDLRAQAQKENRPLIHVIRDALRLYIEMNEDGEETRPYCSGNEPDARRGRYVEKETPKKEANPHGSNSANTHSSFSGSDVDFQPNDDDPTGNGSGVHQQFH